ncbi:hypothetical protein GLYMA_13G175950v4 [Glycine max]|nr:hypothetical protein GLYMA_13G175950v4 [Glycine max]KAH1102051.1 hypothetical protein GYH30_036550 [Glycine max]
MFQKNIVYNIMLFAILAVLDDSINFRTSPHEYVRSS